MGEVERVLEGKVLERKEDNDGDLQHWGTMEGGNNIGACDSVSSESSFGDSITSLESSSSSDLMEDATSSSSTSPPSFQPLCEWSEVMAQLPIKRGLSKCYNGKSQTFTYLGSVKSLEDLAKKERPQKRKMKSCKSYGGGLDHHLYSPKPAISKKTSSSRLSLLSTSLGRRGALGLDHVHKNLL